MPKTVTVFGATGAQARSGGGVVVELLKSPEWRVRAATRSPDSLKAKSLESQGVQIVSADFDFPETLVAAIQGAEVVFGVTDYWQYIEKYGNIEAGNIETKQGFNLVDALASSSTVKHFIWSTLPAATAESPGRIDVPHFNAKHKVDMYLKEKYPELAAKTTFLRVAWYAENMAWYPFFSPHRYGNTEQFVFIQPCSTSTVIPMAGNVRKNIGIFVHAILTHSEISLPSKTAVVAIGYLTYPELLTIWERVTGKKGVYLRCTMEEFEHLYPAAGTELALQYIFMENLENKTITEPGIIGAAELGIEQDQLVGVKETLHELKSCWV